MEEIEGIFDFGLASNNESKILYFLDNLYKIPFEQHKQWEPLIFEFFSKEIIVPYVIQTSIKEEKDEELLEDIKRIFLGDIIYPKTVLISTNKIYEDLIKIKDSLKIGIKLKEYLPFLFFVNFTIRRMLIKKTDDEDTRFNEFKCGIKPMSFEITTSEGFVGYESVYFILPDNSLDYPFNEWHKNISSNWRQKLKAKFNKKDNIKRRDPIESRLRHEVFKRDRYKCKECGKTKIETTLHCDHIISVAQGGTDELDNLQTLCQACNLAKTNRTWESKS